MNNSRNISFKIPKDLLDQIEKRAVVNSRSRNAELRYLLRLGLEYAGDSDVHVALPKQDCRGIIWMGNEIEGLIKERAQVFQRSMGLEIVRLLAHAIQVSTDRDIALIKEMIQRSGQAAPAPQ